MRKTKYEDLSLELKALVKKMEKDLNSQKNQENLSESTVQILTDYPIANRSMNSGDETVEYDVAVFRVATDSGKYIFSYIETKT